MGAHRAFTSRIKSSPCPSGFACLQTADDRSVFQKINRLCCALSLKCSRQPWLLAACLSASVQPVGSRFVRLLPPYFRLPPAAVSIGGRGRPGLIRLPMLQAVGSRWIGSRPMWPCLRVKGRRGQGAGRCRRSVSGRSSGHLSSAPLSWFPVPDPDLLLLRAEGKPGFAAWPTGCR